MHNSDDTPLSMFLMNLAFARGALGANADNRYVRGRIALLICLPVLAVVVMFATSIHSWVVGVAGYVLLIVGVWLYAERADQVGALIKRFSRRGKAAKAAEN